MNALDVFAESRPNVDGLDPDRFDAIAAEVFGAGPMPKSDEPGELAVEPAPVTRGRVRWLVFAAAAAVVALVAGLAAVAGDRDVEAPATPPTELPAVSVEPLRLLPADTSPYEFTASVNDAFAEATGSHVYAVLARPSSGGGFSDPIWVERRPRGLDDLDGVRRFAPFDMQGREMQFVEEIEGGYRLVQFDVGDGTIAAAWTVREGVAGTVRDELAAILLSLDVTADSVDLAALPGGYELVARGRYSPESWRYLDVMRAEGVALSVSTVVSSDPGFGFRTAFKRIEPVVIRGRNGWVTTVLWQTDGGLQEFAILRWEERPGHWVEVRGADVVGVAELEALAASLVEVDAAAYAAVVDEETPPPFPGSEATVPTTAPVTETSVAVPPPSTVPSTMAPQTAPAGTVLVANGTRTPGIAGRTTRMLERSGVEMADPTDATGDVFTTSVLYVRPGAEALGSWVTARFAGAHAVTTLDDLDQDRIVGGLRDADVVLVLGLDAIVPLTTPIVFGDGVVLGAADVLTDRGYDVNAEVSRQLFDLVPDVEAVLAETRPNVVVVHIGTNGPIRRDDLDRLLAVTADVPNVVLVNAHADRAWVDTNNALLDEVDRPDDNIIVLDWDSLADDCPGDCFAADDLHLAEAGREYFADILGDITGY